MAATYANFGGYLVEVVRNNGNPLINSSGNLPNNGQGKLSGGVFRTINSITEIYEPLDANVTSSLPSIDGYEHSRYFNLQTSLGETIYAVYVVEEEENSGGFMKVTGSGQLQVSNGNITVL